MNKENKDKRVKYVKINNDEDAADKSVGSVKRAGSSGSRRGKKKKHVIRSRVGHVLSVIGTTLLAMLMIIIITICIVATALTVYVMQFAEDSFDIDLRNVELSFTSNVYGYNEEGTEVLLKQLNTDENRVWVDIEDLPQYVIDAFVATEDKRFFEHDGVDWTRTVGSAVKALISSGTDGGSTITQQLVRNVTADTEVTVARKLREIFRALSLEQKYTKMDILESYLNRVPFGSTSYGIGSASVYYFDKEASELTVAEAAILSGILRSPSNYNPYASAENARTRQLYVLHDCMYAQGKLSTAEYEAAVAEQVRFRRPVAGDYFGYVDERYNEYYGIIDETDEATEEDLYYVNESWEDVAEDVAYKWNGDYEVTQDWYTDATINQVVTDLAELKGISETAAREELYKGGYSIYSNVNIELQKIINEKFADPFTIVSDYDVTAASADLLQASFVLMDYHGNVLAIAGGVGEKPGDNCYNRATQSLRAIGSTIKPIATYSTAIDKNLITYSSMIRDISGEVDLPLEEEEETDESVTTTTEETEATTITDPITGAQIDPEHRYRWPQNYEHNDNGSGLYYPAWYAVQKSTNTVAARVLSMVGIKSAFSQLSDRLGISSLDSMNDMAWAPLATGALTNGIKLYELAASYQIFGNGGVYYEPYFYSKVTDSDGEVVLEQNTLGVQAIAKDAAWVTNRMMYQVTHDYTGGSGIHALFTDDAGNDMVEVIGKTGTSNDMCNLLFMGLTPSYIGAYRIGYDDNKAIEKSSNWRTLAKVWKSVMVDIVDTSINEAFTPDPTVVVANYCNETGLLATSKCPNTTVGYYRASNIPDSCDSKHDGEYWVEHADDTIPYYGIERN